MKKLLLFSVLSLLGISLSFAQEDPEKLVKKALKSFNAFNLEPNTKGASLDEAKATIDEVFKSEAMNSNVGALLAKGQIYGGYILKQQTQKLLNPAYNEKLDFPAAFTAYEAYSKALELGQKKFEKSDALKGLQGLTGELNNTGNELYNEGNFEGAFNHFLASLMIHEKMKANAQASALDKPEDYNNQLFILAASAVKAKKFAEAKLYNDKLIAANYLDGGIYENNYEILMDAGDTKGAEMTLEEGRKKLPDDVGLMFKEINHFIRLGRLDLLVDRLKSAIEKEPKNTSLYTTLGNVYDNLYQKDSIVMEKDAAGNYTVMASVNSNINFKSAEKYFTEATQLDPKNGDAHYGLGAFYYNVAARMTAILNKLADDYSKEGSKKYEAIKVEVFTMFDKSLPSFKMAESINPNDRNTLIALKEIYARENKFDLSNEFKKRLEIIEAGGSNPSSYHKN